MANPLTRYMNWLHTRWPAGVLEPLPETDESGATNVPGVYVAGDLTGIPLLKFSLDTGVRVVRRIASELDSGPSADRADVLDLVIVGAGVSGMAAAAEARTRGLRFEILEASEPFSTIVNFPRGKPIYTYPQDMQPAGTLQVSADRKETLLDELQSQARELGLHAREGRVERIERRQGHVVIHVSGADPLKARNVLVAIGRSGNFRRLGCIGDTLGKVYNRLHDPNDFRGKRCLVVGGGDSAVETAVALAESGARVTLAYRGDSFSRCKASNVERLDLMCTGMEGIEVRRSTGVTEIREDAITLRDADGALDTIDNDVVFAMIGREAPLDFFRRSGVAIANEMTAARWSAMGLFLLFCTWLYNWKSGGMMADLWHANGWFPTNLPELLARAGASVASAAGDPSTLVGTLAISAAGPAFWYTLAYSLIVVVFGVRRVQRRRTPYVTAQTVSLMAVQALPLFLIPELILPLLHHNGALHVGFANALFPEVTYGHGREFWRAYGLILAWPLNVYNIFTDQPLWWWIGIGVVQTFVLIPIGIYYWGKGVYCGWICSCGALAETLGDTHRHKMPHGPGWNRFNMFGQGVLALAVVLLLVRIAGWVLPDGNAAAAVFNPLKDHYKWWIDVFLAGVVGYGVYFWYSGRVWCRFMCPLAALMHVYARFSRFRILADKQKCISCNQCTTVCHQGIDVQSFANKGIPMADPECVRCSACVQSCPTGVLQFGQVDRSGSVISVDSLLASPVKARESR